MNRPIAEVSTNQRDGYHQSRVHQGRTAYVKNSLSGGCPAIADERVFRHYQERVDGHKIRKRATSFQDYYSQATLFWNSMSDWEREHIVAAFRFELGKVDHMHIRQAVVEHLTRVDHRLAVQVAEGVGVKPPTEEAHPNHRRSSPALSQANNATGSIRSRKVAVLVADGVEAGPVAAVGAGVGLIGPATANVLPLATADGAITNEHGVLGAPSATTELPEGFIESFCDSLAAHRVWTRPTAAILA